MAFRLGEKQVRAPRMTPIEALRVGRPESVHGLFQIDLPGSKQKVVAHLNK